MKPASGGHLKLVFGLKLKQLRQDRQLGLKDIAQRTGLSVSYLSEIESGKKYPKPEKMLALSKALGLSFDDLVSTRLSQSLDPLTQLLDSPVVREFPFHLFGINLRQVIDLVTDSPEKSGALFRTLTEITRTYDLSLEDFLFAAMRSYQKYKLNYFGDIEKKTTQYRKKEKLGAHPSKNLEGIQAQVINSGCKVENLDLETYPQLAGLRSVFDDAPPQRLLVNPNLLPSQKAFILGRELGYRELGLSHRAKTSSWLEVESFDQVLDHFHASYFSGALLIPEKEFVSDLKKCFKEKHWAPELFSSLMQKYGVTPEMFLYRLSQLIPTHFGIHDIYYLRFNRSTASPYIRLTKELNMSSLGMPSGISLHEHYCQRWLAIQHLNSVFQKLELEHSDDSLMPEIAIQKSHFLDQNLTILNINVVRPLSLNRHGYSSMSLGLVITPDLTKKIHFANDPSIPHVEVNETCERCFLSPEACSQRQANPWIYQAQQGLQNRKEALKTLLHDGGGGTGMKS